MATGAWLETSLSDPLKSKLVIEYAGSLADGPYVARVPAGTVKDANPLEDGTNGEIAWSFTVLTAPPVVLNDPIVAPVSGALVVEGTVEPGANVVVRVEGLCAAVSCGMDATAADTDGGRYTVTFDGEDFAALDDGELAVTATATAGDRPSAEATTTAVKDAIAPAPGATAPSDGDMVTTTRVPLISIGWADEHPLGAGERLGEVRLTRDEDGEDVEVATTVSFDPATNDLRVTFSEPLLDGSYRVDVPAAAIVDLAGNVNEPKSWTFSIAVDEPEPTDAPVIEEFPLLINAGSQTNVTVGGTAEPDAPVLVIVSDGDPATEDLEFSGESADVDGAWAYTGLDFSALTDGPVTATAFSGDVVSGTDADDDAEWRSLPAVGFKDATAPTAEVEPADGGETFGSRPLVRATFNEPVMSTAGAPEVDGTSLIREDADGFVEIDHVAVLDVVTVHFVLTEDVEPGDYTASIPADSLTDLAGNQPVADIIWRFTVTRPSGPVPTDMQPKGVVRIHNPDVAVTFDRSIGLADDAEPVVFEDLEGDAPDAVVVSVDGNRLLVGYEGTLGDATYTVTVPQGVVVDEQDQPNPAFAWMFHVEAAAPTVTVDPRPVPVSDELGVGGTVEPGASVTVELCGAPGDCLSQGGGDTSVGRYAATFDIAGFDDGALAITATATAEGRPDGVATGAATKDATAPAADTDSFSPPDGTTVGSRTPMISVAFDDAHVMAPGEGLAEVTLTRFDSAEASGDGDPVASAALFDPATATLRVAYDGPLPNGTYVVAVPDGAVVDIAGNGNEPFSWTFTVVAGPVANRPPVITSFPAWVNADMADSVSVAGTAEPSVSVSLRIADADDATDDLVLDPVVADDQGDWVFEDVIVTGLSDGLLIAVATTPEIVDGSDVDDPADWTSPPATGWKDTRRPTATFTPTGPAPGPRPVVRATFDEAVRSTGDPVLVDGTTLERTDGEGGTYGHTAVIDVVSVHLVVSEDLPPGEYIASIPAGSLTDLAGNQPAADLTWSFAVTAPTHPTATGYEPVGVADKDRPVIAVTFDRDVTLLEGATVSLVATDQANNPSGVGPIQAGPRRIEVVYDGALRSDTYTATLDAGAVQDADDSLKTNDTTTWAFRVETVAPTVTVDPRPVPVRAELVVEGTVEPGASVTVELCRAADCLTPQGGGDTSIGRFAATFDIAGFDDGVLAITATAMVEGRPPGGATGEATKDATAPAAVTDSFSPDDGETVGSRTPMISVAFDDEHAMVPGEGLAGVVLTRYPSPEAAAAGDGGSETPSRALFDPATTTLRVAYDGPLPNGTYVVAVPDAAVVDIAGNGNEPLSWTFTVVAGAVTIDALPEWVNAQMVDERTFEVSGTAPAGADVTVTVTDSEVPATQTAKQVQADATGKWSTGTGDDPDALDLSGLEDGRLTVTAQTGDGFLAAAETQKDTVAPGTPTLVVPERVDPETGDEVAVSGVTEPNATVLLTATDGATTVEGEAPADEDGAYDTTLNLSTLANGAVTVTAVARDAAGNTGADAASAQIDKGTADAPVFTATGAAGDWEVAFTSDRPLDPASVDTNSAGGWDDFDTDDTGRGIDAVVLEDDDHVIVVYFDGSLPSGGSITLRHAAVRSTAGGFNSALVHGIAPQPPTITSAPERIDQTNEASVTVQGTAEPGSTVAVTATDSQPQSVTAESTEAGEFGHFSVSMDVRALANGDVTFTATATNTHTSAPSAPWTATKQTDINGPEFTTVPAFVNAATQHAVAVAGTAEPGSEVTLTFSRTGSTPVQRVVTADADGAFTAEDIDLSGLVDGTVKLEGVARKGGNTSGTTVHTFVKDTVSEVVITTAPAQITSANHKAVTIGGTADPNATVDVTIADGDPDTDDIVHNRTANASGGWSVADEDLSGLRDGTVTVTAVATDPYGNVSEPATRSISKLTENPIAFDPAPGHINKANHAAYTVQGTTRPGLDVVVTLTDKDARTLRRETKSDPTGWFSATFDTSPVTVGGVVVEQRLVDGAVRVHAEVTDGANVDEVSVEVIRDIVPPGNPVITQPAATTTHLDAQASEAVTVSGTAESGATVRLLVRQGDRDVIDEHLEAIGDAWSTTVDLSGEPDGSYTVTASATDRAGNPSAGSASRTLVKDTVAPATPVIATFTDPINNADKAKVQVSGTAEAGSTVRLTIHDAAEPPTQIEWPTTIASGGNYAFTNRDVTSLADGVLTATVVATDAAGNASAPVTATAVKDTLAPAKPVITFVTDPINNANRNDVELRGTAEPGATVTLTVESTGGGDGPTSEQTAIVNGDGDFTIRPVNLGALGEGTLTFTVTATDPAGNTSVASDEVTATYRVNAPVAPSAPDVDADVISQRNHEAVGVSGAVPTGAVEVIVTATLGEQTISETAGVDGGFYQATLDLRAMSDGEVNFTAVAKDVAHNPSPPSPATTVTKNTAAPTFTVIGAIGDRAVIFRAHEALDETTIDTTSAASDFTADSARSITGVSYNAETFEIRVAFNGPLVDGDSVTLIEAAIDSAIGNPNTGRVHTIGAGMPTITGWPATVNAATQTQVPVAGSTGSSDPRATVHVDAYDAAGTTIPAVTVTADGHSWSAELDVTALDDGEVIVRATVPATSSFPATQTLHKDTHNAFTVDEYSQWVTETFLAAGTAEPGSTVDVVIEDARGQDERAQASTAAAEDGEWDLAVDVADLLDGALAVTITVTDPADNSDTQALDDPQPRKDTVAPAPPVLTTVTTPVNAANVDSGDERVRASATGVAEPGTVVRVTFTGGTESAEQTTTAAASGTFAAVVDVTDLPDGPLTVTAVATDLAGNTGDPSPPAATVKDVVAPDAVAGSHRPAAVTTSPSPAVSVKLTETVVPQPAFTGAKLERTDGTMADTVAQAVLEPDAQELTVRFVYRTQSEDANGAPALEEMLPDGAYTATIPAGAFVDAVGNPSPVIAWSFQIDTVALTVALDDEALDPANIANHTAYTVSGATNKPDATVTVTATDELGGESAPVPADVDESGAFTAELDLSELADGEVEITATATHPPTEGSATDTAEIVKDTAAPGEPVLGALGAVNAANAGAFPVTGSAEPEATVHVQLDDGVAVVDGSAVADEDGDFSLDVDVTSLADGPVTVTAWAVDAVGNVGATATDSIVKDATLPGPPREVVATAANAAAKVTWKAPEPNGASEILSYTVTTQPGGGKTTVGGDALSTTITGLTNGTAYTFTVAATTAAGTGGTSAPSNSVTPTAPTSGGGGGGGGGEESSPSPSPSPSPTPSPTPSPSPSPSPGGGSGPATEPAPGPLPAPGSARVSGQDRASTAAALSAATFAAGVPSVYLATAGNFADALSGGPAAAHDGGPVLLAERDRLPDATRAELQRLQPGRVVVLGGDGAISHSVAAEIAATGAAVERMAGKNRFETAAAVSRATFPQRAPVVYVATGGGFADALSGGAAAARDAGPVLLVSADGIPQVIAEELRRLDPRQIVVLGGSAVVPTDIEAALADYTDGRVERVFGSDRYATSAAVAARAFPVVVDTVYVATGENFPDALAGVPAAAREKAPLLLVRRDGIPEPVGAQLERLRPRRIVILGGGGAVSHDTERALSAYTVE